MCIRDRSYAVNELTRDTDPITRQFKDGDIEIQEAAEFRQFRQSLRVIETYTDPFVPEFEIPKNVAKWHGYPEVTEFPKQPYTNNRFTKSEDLTNFDELSPWRARQKAVELARSKNAEWLPDGVSQDWHKKQRAPYETVGTLVGTLQMGEVDETIQDEIQPALKVLGSVVDLLSIDGTVFRFHYHGLMKNKQGMAAWTETLIRDCGVEVTGVIFETGWRRRDPAYDGGDPYYGYQEQY